MKKALPLNFKMNLIQWLICSKYDSKVNNKPNLKEMPIYLLESRLWRPIFKSQEIINQTIKLSSQKNQDTEMVDMCILVNSRTWTIIKIITKSRRTKLRTAKTIQRFKPFSRTITSWIFHTMDRQYDQLKANFRTFKIRKDLKIKN